jgi:hypothetical protein
MSVAKSGFLDSEPGFSVPPPRLSKQLSRLLLEWHRFCVWMAVTVTRVVAIRFSQVSNSLATIKADPASMGPSDCW